jgi:hypothetical protein
MPPLPNGQRHRCGWILAKQRMQGLKPPMNADKRRWGSRLSAVPKFLFPPPSTPTGTSAMPFQGVRRRPACLERRASHRRRTDGSRDDVSGSSRQRPDPMRLCHAIRLQCQRMAGWPAREEVNGWLAPVPFSSKVRQSKLPAAPLPFLPMRVEVINRGIVRTGLLAFV